MASDEDIKAMDRASTLISQGITLRNRARNLARQAEIKIKTANKILAELEMKKPKLKVIK